MLSINGKHNQYPTSDAFYIVKINVLIKLSVSIYVSLELSLNLIHLPTAFHTFGLMKSIVVRIVFKPFDFMVGVFSPQIS